MSTATEQFDVAVIGAGIGGLCAAALLARRGRRVIVFDALDGAGGRARSQLIEGCTLPRGALAFQTNGVLAAVCDEVGARFPVREVNQAYFWMRGGNGFAKLPARGGVRRMLELFTQVEGGGRAASQLALQMALTRIGRAVRDEAITDPGDGISFRDWLRQYTDNAALLDLFHAITSAISQVNDHEYPAKHWFAHTSKALSDGRFDRFALLPGGFASLASALLERILAMGGAVRLATPVARIVVEDGRARGIVLAAGSQRFIAADTVISNAGPRGTLALAGGAQALGAAYASTVERRVRPTPIVATFVISDTPLVDVEGSLLFAGLSRIVSGVPVTNTCPEWAPAGKHILAFYGTPASCLAPMNRAEERARNIEDVYTVFPDLEARGGRILDVQLRDIDDPDVTARSWPGFEMPVTTPLPNLFNVGDGCAPLGYVATPAAARSAQLAVEAVLRNDRPVAADAREPAHGWAPQ